MVQKAATGKSDFSFIKSSAFCMHQLFNFCLFFSVVSLLQFDLFYPGLCSSQAIGWKGRL